MSSNRSDPAKKPFNQKLYYCSQCKKVVEQLEQLFFVESGSPRGFCAESCIENYYSPLVGHFEKLGEKLRIKYKVVQEGCVDAITESSTIEKVVHDPDEVWWLENDMKEEVYTLLRTFDDPHHGVYAIAVLCFILDGQVSFILGAWASAHPDFINEFRIGSQIEDVQELLSKTKDSSDEQQGMHEVEIDHETMMLVESKKSSLLAKLLEERSPADIPVEAFAMYENYFAPTLESPDEIYQSKDREGDEIVTYIKSHEREGVSFFYLVTCLKYQSNWTSAQETVLPILAFPTVDGEMCNSYRKGQMRSGVLKS